MMRNLTCRKTYDHHRTPCDDNRRKEKPWTNFAGKDSCDWLEDGISDEEYQSDDIVAILDIQVEVDCHTEDLSVGPLVWTDGHPQTHPAMLALGRFVLSIRLTP